MLLHGAPRMSEAELVADADATTTVAMSGNNTTAVVPIWRRRYKAVRVLGEGGMGRVVLAERLSDSLLVCLKFLNRDTDPRTAEQECRALMRLRHPSIVSLVDFSLVDKPPWLATEYIDGTTLQMYLKEHSPVPMALAVEIVRRILEALDYAHGEKIIHRDLKPANLMIDMEHGVRIRMLDFGIAIVDEFDHAGRQTAEGSKNLMGTLLYMAPEQFKGQLLTNACDLYAIGFITWEMLMGRAVFQGETIAQMVYERVTQTKGFVLSGNASAVVPAWLSSFVEACTRPEPGARPTAREGLAILQSL